MKRNRVAYMWLRFIICAVLTGVKMLQLADGDAEAA